MHDNHCPKEPNGGGGGNVLLIAALEYAKAGVAVFPCEPSDKRPIGALVPPDLGPDRKPIPGTGGFKKATTDPATITTWWTMRPDAMIGAATGAASGFFAIDPDAPKQVKGVMTEDGRQAWEQLKAEHGGHDPTIEVSTPGGGRHVYFRYDPERPLTNREGALAGRQINVRGDGGYVILPPSARWPDGRAYAANMPFDRAALADAPDWLHELIGASPAAPDAKRWSDFMDYPHTAMNEAKLRTQLGYIPSDDRGMWFRVGAALHTLDNSWGDRSHELWDQWSKKSAKFEPRVQDRTWRNFRDDRIDAASIRTVNLEARIHGSPNDLADFWETETDALANDNQPWGPCWGPYFGWDRADNPCLADAPLEAENKKEAPPPPPKSSPFQSAPPTGKKLRTTLASEISAEPIKWLWRGWVAVRVLHIMAGQAGEGKSTIAFYFAATISKGGQWPDGTQAEARNVVIWSGEDTWENTIVPRLIRMDADLNRIERSRYRGGCGVIL